MTTEPVSSIQWLFGKLGAAYGAAWDRSLGATPIEDVQAEWNKRLLGFTAGDIRYALDHLPSSKPPNVFEFRDLCRASPKKQVPLLEQTPANPQRVAELAKQVRESFGTEAKKDPKAWAHKLQKRHESGEKLGAHQIRAYREALGLDGRQPWQ